MGLLKSSDNTDNRPSSPLMRGAYTLAELAPMERVQQLLESHYRVIQIPIGLVAPDNTVLLEVGWKPVCVNFHRVHPESERCCIDSNQSLQSQLREGTMAAQKCGNGLWDVAMPIVVEKQHLATIFVGQFFYEDEPFTEPFFAAQAKRFDYDKTAYFQALEQVPRLSRERARQIIDYTAELVALLAETCYKNNALSQEVHERRLAEYALREGERQYRALVGNVPGAVYLCLNDDDFTTIFISDAITEITGYSAQHMIDDAASIAAMIHPDDVGCAHQRVDEGLARQKPYVLNYRLRCKNGAYTQVEERGQGVWDEAGALRFLQGVIFDVSERHKIEEQRRKLDADMERLQKFESLSILAGGIAHDFNNLLVGILGHADLVASDIEPNSLSLESIHAIIENAKRAAELTRQMLAYAGKSSMGRTPADLASIVEQGLATLETTLPETIVVRHEVLEKDLVVPADAAQLRQLVVNLVSNAAESYDDAQGEIVVRTGTMQCDEAFIQEAYHTEHHVEGLHGYIEVIDQGCGMDEDTVRHLCDPFYTTKFLGRGLGMAAVFGIVRGHNGMIAVDSAPCRGTRIQALFPMTVMSKATPKQQPITTEPASIDGYILLVDDEEMIRKVARKMLERNGFQVMQAQGGAEALQIIRDEAQRICCIILDLTMPRMNGVETFKAIRHINKTIPIILSSGYTRDDVFSRLDGQEPAAFLEKPYRMTSLIQTLQTVVTSEAAPGNAPPDAGSPQ